MQKIEEAFTSSSCVEVHRFSKLLLPSYKKQKSPHQLLFLYNLANLRSSILSMNPRICSTLSSLGHGTVLFVRSSSVVSVREKLYVNVCVLTMNKQSLRKLLTFFLIFNRMQHMTMPELW